MLPANPAMIQAHDVLPLRTMGGLFVWRAPTHAPTQHPAFRPRITSKERDGETSLDYFAEIVDTHSFC